MFSLLVSQFLVVLLLNRQLRYEVIHCLLARWGPLQESDGVVGGVDVVQGGVGLATVAHDGLHHVDPGHGWTTGESDLCLVVSV